MQLGQALKDFSFLLFLTMTILYSLLVIYIDNDYILAITGILTAISFIFFLQHYGVNFFPRLRPYTYTIYLLQWFVFVAVRNICFYILGWNIIVCYVLMFVLGVFLPVFIGWGGAKNYS